ncbi:MAG: amidohydrolase [candidate division KSB1 bacterium]|nr:amidohydrolase [candidate division KSB1 bacterium]MDZ7273708.1 amidohydrolase [candidate division KSB1 bacterium]MDZ7285864.1 amidohydrolase [candidate division KSB1 bacterium]MDZ7298896.1 amidohydrolase [candidate division KSB1 bacterium]MDZ7309454.1 amidohydrolase [candidate division KSB1 bacterium]
MLACQSPQEKAEVIYTNATIWTGVPEAPQAQALAIAGGKILAVGAADEIAAWRAATTRVVDLAGKFVVPGFIDNHTHFMSGGFQLASVDLRDAKSPQEFAQRLAAFAQKLPAGRWITGGDWDHERWGGELPRRDWIDQLTPDHPVFVNRLDGHMALANSKALALAGIDRHTADPPGGAIVRDAKSGEPTGILKDEAMSLVYRVIPARTPAEHDEALARAMAHAAAMGVTQVHDMGSYGWTDLETYRRAHASGALTLRIYSFVPLATWARLAEYVQTHGRGDDWLRWGGLKGFVDGSLGSTTAWFYQPYDDAPATSGLLTTDTTALRQWILAADSAGLHVAVHAIGDRANDWLLQVYARAVAQNGSRDRRFRIEHAQHLTRAAILRFAGLGVIPSMQPYHAIDDGRWAEKRIGPQRIKTTYAFRSLLAANAALTFGSDWTVAPLSPLWGIYAAVTRRTLDDAHPAGWVPEEKITVAEALRCYTSANAYAGFQEQKCGRLAPGFLADFVVLSENLFEIDPVRIPEVLVLRTVVGGRESFVRQ